MLRSTTREIVDYGFIPRNGGRGSEFEDYAASVTTRRACSADWRGAIKIAGGVEHESAFRSSSVGSAGKRIESRLSP